MQRRHLLAQAAALGFSAAASPGPFQALLLERELATDDDTDVVLCGLLAGADLLARVIAAISYSIERLNAHLGSRLLRHIRQLMAIRANVRHLVGHNQMVLGIDCGLHVVADNSSVLAARCHRTRISSLLKNLARANVW